MPWAMALRVVSFPATDSSMKNRLKSISVSESPSTSALSSVVTMSGCGSARRFSASACAYMNISTWASMTLSSPTRYSGSSAPIMRFDQSKSLKRSSLGTPEQLGDDLERQLRGHVDDEVAVALGDGLVDDADR